MMISDTDETVGHLASVDWLTCTSNSKRTGYDWFDLFRRYQNKYAEMTGYPPMIKQAKRLGYKGRVGEGMFFGVSEKQGYLLVAWGEASDVVWPIAAPIARNITRIDLAVTAQLDPPDPTLANVAYMANCEPGKRQYALIQNSRDGKTLYVGSRSSTQFGRLYDKGVKDLGLPSGQVWRYEIELKDKALNSAVVKGMMGRWRLGVVHRGDIAAYVHQWFSVRGVSPKFSAMGKGLPRPELEASVSTAEKKLRWLSAQVAPTVQELIRIGLGDRALLALGLEAEQLPFWSHDVVHGRMSGDE